MNERDLATNKTILIGEDDKDDEEILEEIFLKINPSVRLHFINNGQKIVSYLQNMKDEQIPSLIILDYNMPGLNGAEILNNLGPMDRLKNVPKIIWSTSNADGYKNSCLQLGASDYLVKPSSIHELENIIRHMLSYRSSTH